MRKNSIFTRVFYYGSLLSNSDSWEWVMVMSENEWKRVKQVTKYSSHNFLLYFLQIIYKIQKNCGCKWMIITLYSCGQKKRRTFWNFFWNHHNFVSFWDSVENVVSLERWNHKLFRSMFCFLIYSFFVAILMCLWKSYFIFPKRLLHFDSSNMQKNFFFENFNKS